MPALGPTPLPRVPGTVALAGDWHGNLHWAQRMLSLLSRDTEARVVVHLGDFGFWRPRDRATKTYLDGLEAQLTAADMTLYWVDGNHEDHFSLADLPIDPDTGLRAITRHIGHLPRGHRWIWTDDAGNAYTWMALGGAVSVDRDVRTIGLDWWPQETMSDADITRAIDGGPVDVLVTHDCPSGADPEIPGISGNPQGWPADAIADADRHRERLRTVVEAVRPRALWHGHYHVQYEATLCVGDVAQRPDWDGVCAIHGLDCDASNWSGNLALADASGRALPWPHLH